jgi:hypothetical protein
MKTSERTGTPEACASATVCPVCGGAVAAGDKPCPHCCALPPWRDLVKAIEFTRSQFSRWRDRSLIDEVRWAAKDRKLADVSQRVAAAAREGRAVPPETGLTPASSCWRCGRPVEGFYSYCNTCGAPLGESADRLRYLAFTLREVSKSTAAELTLAQVHACATDVQNHAAALRAELERGRLSGDGLTAARLDHLRDLKSGTAVRSGGVAREPNAVDALAAAIQERRGAQPSPRIDEPPPAPAPPSSAPPSRRSILEILLDPRSIQWLLASGGVLLAVGLVIWLASLGVFKNPLVVATCMGAGTLTLLAGGCGIVKLTRYQLAGRAIALLACLVMPLNLWFYHAHDLVTLDGHLWLAAVVCCGLYAVAAAVLADPVLVYVLFAGVAMTGMMVLADLHRLMQVASPATLLVALGLIALHAERAFPVGDGPFARKRFGMACFWSAQGLLAGGLLLLLCAQVIGHFPMAISWLDGRPLIVTDPTQRLLAIGLVLAGAYAYFYSDLIVRRVGVYLYVSAFTLLWAELLAIDLTHLAQYPSVLIGALAVTALAVNIAQAIAMGRDSLNDSPRLTRPLPVLGMLLSSAPVLYGVMLHLRAVNADVHNAWPYTVTWAYVTAMALTAVSCRISAFLVEKRSTRMAAGYLAATAAATLVAAAGFLSLLGLKTWPVQSPVLMVVPILYLLASRIYQGRPAQRPLRDVAHVATMVVLLGVMFSAMHVVRTVEPVVGTHLNLWMALFCAEASIFYVIAAVLGGGEGINVYLATAMACGSAWQVLNFFNCPGEYYCVTFGALGTAMLVAYRLSAWERVAPPALVVAAFRCANALVSLSLLATAFLAMSRLALGTTSWSLAILLAAFVALALMSAGLVRLPNFRRWYVTMSIIEAALTFVVVERQSHLSPWQHIEFFCVGVGVVLLVVGYSLWYREQDRQSDAASFCLLMGSLLAGVPLAIAAIVNRFGYQVSLVDELGLLTISVLMFVSGFLCRLRATTLVGGGLLVIHLAMLLAFVGMQAQLAVGAYLAIGGAGLFGLGVLLSVYRDRLLALPKQIKQHEGVFKVLAWR